MAESPVAQKLGQVTMFNAKDYELFMHYDRAFVKDVAAIHKAIPGKIVACHGVVRVKHDVFRKIILPVIKFILGKRWRQHLVIHSGPDRRVLQELCAFGISEEGISCAVDRKLQPLYAEQWVRKRRVWERDNIEWNVVVGGVGEEEGRG